MANKEEFQSDRSRVCGIAKIAKSAKPAKASGEVCLKPPRTTDHGPMTPPLFQSAKNRVFDFHQHIYIGNADGKFQSAKSRVFDFHKNEEEQVLGYELFQSAKSRVFDFHV